MIWKKETERFSVNKKRNKISFAAILLVCLCMCSTFVYAAGTRGSGEVYDGCRYDATTDMYSYNLPEYSEPFIYANILNDTYTNNAVRINAASGVSFMIYKNGQQYTDANQGRVSDPGEYAVAVYGSTGRQEIILKFTILSRYVSAKKLEFPSTCKVESVMLDGVQIDNNSSYVEFEQEGTYEIEYVVRSTEKTEHIHVVYDHTAPVILFEGLPENNEAHGAVHIAAIEDKTTTVIYRDGNPIDFTRTLDQSGRYRIVAQDEANNQAVYEFTIFPYYNFSSLLFLGLCAGVLVVVVIYVVFLKKNLRVR